MSKKKILKLIFVLVVLLFNVFVIRNGRFGGAKGDNITLGISVFTDKETD